MLYPKTVIETIENHLKTTSMKSITFIILLLIVSANAVYCQVGINTTDPDPSAELHVKSTNKGLIIPRMTTSQRINNITSPADGLLVYDTDLKMFFFWNSTDNQWQSLNAWKYRSPEEDGTEYDLYTLLSTNVGIGVLIPEEKLHVDGNVKINNNLYVEGNADISGDLDADDITANSIAGDGTNITNVDAEELDGHDGTYYATATDVTDLQNNKADLTDVYAGSQAVTVSTTAYCGNSHSAASSNVIYTQIGNMVFVSGNIFFDVTSEYRTICAHLTGLPAFPDTYGLNATGADLAYYQSSSFNHYGGSLQFQTGGGGYGNIIQFHRVENRNFATGRWKVAFQFHYYVSP